MPRRIDEDGAFTGVTVGAIRVIDEKGLSGLSWLAVARASGMSVSAVRHRCDLSHDRLVHLTVLALSRARAERLRRVGPAVAGHATNAVAYALALLPRNESERRDVRVLHLLSADPGLPGQSARVLRSLAEEHRRWCRLVAEGDEARCALVEALTTGLPRAIADRHSPLDTEVAEDLLRELLGARQKQPAHAARPVANLSPTTRALA